MNIAENVLDDKVSDAVSQRDMKYEMYQSRNISKVLNNVPHREFMRQKYVPDSLEHSKSLN